MDCFFCEFYPIFHCTCGNVKICDDHLGNHLRLQGNHSYKRLNTGNEEETIHSSSYEKFKVDHELKNRINLLKEYKNKIFKMTETLIKDIESNCKTAIMKINTFLDYYFKLKYQKEYKVSQKEDIENLIQTEMIINKFEYDLIRDELRKIYLLDFFSFINSDELYNTRYKKFVDSKTIETMNNQKFLKTHVCYFVCLLISNDGTTLFTGSQDNCVRFWDVASKRQTACLDEHKNEISCLGLSDDSLLLASGSVDGMIILWDVKRKQSIGIYKKHDIYVNFIGIDKKNGLIISSSVEETIVFWKIGSKTPIKSINLEFSIRCGVLSSNGIFFALGMRIIQAFDVNSFKIRFQILIEDVLSGNCVAITKNNKFLLVGTDEGIDFWNIPKKKCSYCLLGQTCNVSSLTLSSDDKFFISGSADSTIILWDFRTKAKIHQFYFHSTTIESIVCFNDLIFSIASNDPIGMSQISSKSIETFSSLRQFNSKSQFFRDNIYSYGIENKVIISDLNNDDSFLELRGHEDSVTKTYIFSNKKKMMSLSKENENSLILWNLENNSIISQFKEHDKWVSCLDVSKDEKLAISGDENGLVILWDLIKLQLKFKLVGHSQVVASLKFTEDSKLAVSSGCDGNIFIWNIMNGDKFACLDGYENGFDRILITSDNKYFAEINSSLEIRIWSLMTRIEIFKYSSIEDFNENFQTNKMLKYEVSKYLFTINS